MNTPSLVAASGRVTFQQASKALSATARASLEERLRTLLVAFEVDPGSDELLDLAMSVEEAVGSSLERLWLARSVIGATLPSWFEMDRIRTAFILDGVWGALRLAFGDLRRNVQVSVAVGAVTVDVGNTAGTTFVSGIQRVVRETCNRWKGRPEALFVSWTDDERALRRLTAEEHENLFGTASSPAGLDQPDHAPVDHVVVPWQGTHLIPELAAERQRTIRIAPLNRHSRCQVGYVGFDCVPLMVADTVAPGMTVNFAKYLAGMRHAARVATISHATAAEFGGWRAVCAGRGSVAPEVTAVPLPVEAATPAERELAEVRELLGLGGLPIILVVGSHEPRKNHLAVLHAAELLWRDGLEFTLAMVGARSWKSDAFDDAVAERVDAGRPLLSIRGLPDRLLWAAYEVADFLVFPSLHEGFGLPVAEALAAGTPVITSNFGSTREIVAPDGAPLGGLLVDPRDDHQLADAMRVLLTQPTTLARLRTEARQRPQRTWDDYASELWDYLVEGRAPAG